jgi:hypothetical protein
VGLSGGRGKGVIYRKGVYARTVPEDQFLAEVLKEVASILPEHEAKLIYPGDEALGPVSGGRTRKTGIHDQTEPSKHGKALPMFSATSDGWTAYGGATPDDATDATDAPDATDETEQR